MAADALSASGEAVLVVGGSEGLGFAMREIL